MERLCDRDCFGVALKVGVIDMLISVVRDAAVSVEDWLMAPVSERDTDGGDLVYVALRSPD